MGLVSLVLVKERFGDLQACVAACYDCDVAGEVGEA